MKTCLQRSNQVCIQTGLLRYGSYLEALNLGYSIYRYYAIHRGNNKGTDQTAVAQADLSLLFTYIFFIFMIQLIQNSDSKLQVSDSRQLVSLSLVVFHLD